MSGFMAANIWCVFLEGAFAESEAIVIDVTTWV